jgi:hypothetical protein
MKRHDLGDALFSGVTTALGGKTDFVMTLWSGRTRSKTPVAKTEATRQRRRKDENQKCIVVSAATNQEKTPECWRTQGMKKPAVVWGCPLSRGARGAPTAWDITKYPICTRTAKDRQYRRPMASRQLWHPTPTETRQDRTDRITNCRGQHRFPRFHNAL